MSGDTGVDEKEPDLESLTIGTLIDRLAGIEKQADSLEHNRKRILEALRVRQFKMPRMPRSKRAASGTATKTRKTKHVATNAGLMRDEENN